MIYDLPDYAAAGAQHFVSGSNTVPEMLRYDCNHNLYLHDFTSMKVSLTSPRLTLKEVRSKDLALVHELHSFPEVDRYNTRGLPENIAETERSLAEWLLEQQAVPQLHYVFCITDIRTSEFAGMIGLRLGKIKYRIAEVWYKLHPDHWGKGFATEALNAVLHFGFKDLQLHRIEAGCAVENVASARVMEKAGMQREGHKRKSLPIRGEWFDNFEYAMLEEDFFEMSDV